jgi:hypothetical protein
VRIHAAFDCDSHSVLVIAELADGAELEARPRLPTMILMKVK